MNRDTATTRTPPETGGVLFAGTGGVLLLLISPGKSGRIGWRGGIFIDTSKVLEYKCPCCGAGLVFGEDIQKMTCRSCGNTFDLADVRQYNDTMEEPDAETSPWDDRPGSSWSEEERSQNTGGGGRGGGGSSVHTGSSGRSHGGGHGHF